MCACVLNHFGVPGTGLTLVWKQVYSFFTFYIPLSSGSCKMSGLVELFRQRQNWVSSLGFSEPMILTMLPCAVAFNKLPEGLFFPSKGYSEMFYKGKAWVRAESLLEEHCREAGACLSLPHSLDHRLNFQLLHQEDGKGYRGKRRTTQGFGAVLRDVFRYFPNWFGYTGVRIPVPFVFVLLLCLWNFL